MEENSRQHFGERHKGLTQMKTITNYGMGLMLIAAGFFFMFPTDYTADFLSRYDEVLIKIFAVICWLYGIFRIYRGYKKDYFN